MGLSIKVTDSKFLSKEVVLYVQHNGGNSMENENLFEVGKTYAFVSDLFCSPIEAEIEKIYENSLMVRVLNCADEDNETAHNLHWQLVVRKSSAVKEYSY